MESIFTFFNFQIFKLKKIFLIGFMGSGKTHWGRKLSEKLQLPFFDLDTVVGQTEKNPYQIFLLKKAKNIFATKKKKCWKNW